MDVEYKTALKKLVMKISKKLSIVMIASAFLVAACSEGVKKDEPEVKIEDLTKNQPEVHGQKLSESDISLTNPLSAEMIASGKATYDLKCQSCHKLTDERVVGPGWKDVTKRRQPLWIMNMITNVDMMLEEDAEAQKLLELCLVRMPNQNINKDEARSVLEFMRSNDGEK